ncbi:putative fungal pheromoneG-protein-coupled receptor [Polyporus arcularius HHB13444]|uniref:Putative fungal pheromoneG-protein-coupled receptor n=1 Tax=Polyporus arcularius HHB13444 TaxID=1314778 RepID=A0A5C3PP72_9APHY|nr:putative fungal pheromoneG-protein-coupled receptor [Polyporus arcularius HHB13444]
MAVPWLVQVDINAAFSLLGFILISVPLYWHLEAWNVGCVLYIFWMGGECLIQFINMMIWRDNAINVAPVWCDITTRFNIASGLGVCCASLVINRRLYHIANVSAVSMSRADKRRNLLTDLLIGLGVPVVGVALYWFYQGHRFDILEGIGCIEEYPNTFLAYLLYVCWPIPIGLVSATYCTLTLRAFFHRRRQFNELMASNNNLTFNRYFRLMGLAAIEVLFTIPLTIYNIIENLRVAPIYEYRGLADLHYRFSRVNSMSAIAWRASPELIKVMNFRVWAPIGCAILFFCFFGLAEEARKHYKLALSSVAKRVGITTMDRSGTGFSSTGSKSGFGRATIPTFVQRNTRRDSMDSFSDRLSTNISISDIEEKTPYSPSDSTAGSSTFISSPVDSEKGKADLVPSPVATNVPIIDFPKPPRVHNPHSPMRQEADVPSSIRHHSLDMV